MKFPMEFSQRGDMISVLFVLFFCPVAMGGGSITPTQENPDDSGIDIDGNATRVDRGAFTDWFLANKGVSDESADADEPETRKKPHKSFFTHWCDWFGKQNATSSYNSSLCQHKPHANLGHHRHEGHADIGAVHIKSLNATAGERLGRLKDASFLTYVNYSTDGNTQDGDIFGSNKTHKTMIILHREVQEYDKRKRETG